MPRRGSKRALMLAAMASGDKTTHELAAVADLTHDEAGTQLRLMERKRLCLKVVPGVARTKPSVWRIDARAAAQLENAPGPFAPKRDPRGRFA